MTVSDSSDPRAIRGTRQLVFYDDARARAFQPFALSRPLCEMRVGAVLLRERWETALRASSAGFIAAPHLAQFVEEGAPASQAGILPAGTVLVNSRAAIALASHAGHAGHAGHAVHNNDGMSFIQHSAWFLDGTLAAFCLPNDLSASVLQDGSITLEQVALLDVAGPPRSSDTTRLAADGGEGRVDVEGVWLEEVWDIVRYLSPILSADIPVLAAALACWNAEQEQAGPIFMGANPVYVEQGAVLEPLSVFDTSLGPVLVRAGATVQAFTRVVGPCYIGRHSTVTSDRITGSSIGDHCRVHGELSASVFVGYSNKGHDGFVGHSIVGRWVNMGAGTTTSNLKNTYGTVSLWTPSGVRDTGLQFLGTMFGDHVKTGIGLRLTTGCLLGMAANVFDQMPPKAVSPFAWGTGEPYDSYDVNKFVETAARMMARRNVTLTEPAAAALRAMHAARLLRP